MNEERLDETFKIIGEQILLLNSQIREIHEQLSRIREVIVELMKKEAS